MTTATAKARSSRRSGRRVLPRIAALEALTGARLDALVGVLTVLVAYWVYAGTAARVGYNTDEGQFMGTARYFNLVFLEHQLSGPAWEHNYHTLTQPMLSRYVVGGGLWMSHVEAPPLNLKYREAEVNPSTRARYLQPETYKDERRLAEERRVDRPGGEQLQAARSTMVVLASAGAGLLYGVTRMLGGPLAGIIAAAIAVWNPTMLTLLPRAHAEAPLYILSLATVLLAFKSAQALPERRSIWWGLSCGICAGLAASAKITAALLIAGLGMYAIVAFLLWLNQRSLLAALAWRWSTLAVIVSMVVFVATNPFLYRDPVGRVRDMLAFRQQEMFGQARLSENEAVPSALSVRLPLLMDRSLGELATLTKRSGVPMDLPLTVVGVAALLVRLARGRRLDGLLQMEGLALTFCAVVVLGVGANLGLDWARYYMPVLTLSPIFVGLGVTTLLRGLQSLTRVT